ncbi:hypothetical protein E0I56_005715 [Escherichia coli]|nr:hypothetical protein [Escherichia coli]
MAPHRDAKPYSSAVFAAISIQPRGALSSREWSSARIGFTKVCNIGNINLFAMETINISDKRYASTVASFLISLTQPALPAHPKHVATHWLQFEQQWLGVSACKAQTHSFFVVMP